MAQCDLFAASSTAALATLDSSSTFDTERLGTLLKSLVTASHAASNASSAVAPAVVARRKQLVMERQATFWCVFGSELDKLNHWLSVRQSAALQFGVTVGWTELLHAKHLVCELHSPRVCFGCRALTSCACVYVCEAYPRRRADPQRCA
jgi:hypothetical protein